MKLYSPTLGLLTTWRELPFSLAAADPLKQTGTLNMASARCRQNKRADLLSVMALFYHESPFYGCWPMNESEPAVDLPLIETSLLSYVNCY